MFKPIQYDINKSFDIKLLKLKGNFTIRSKTNSWGRFGGGWNWKLGFQAGGSTIIISLLIAELRINKYKPREE